MVNCKLCAGNESSIAIRGTRGTSGTLWGCGGYRVSFRSKKTVNGEEMILADFDDFRHNFELPSSFLRRSRSRSFRNHPLNDSQYSRSMGLGHWECLKSLRRVYCNILSPACRSWPVALLRPFESSFECCMQEVFPKSHQ